MDSCYKPYLLCVLVSDDANDDFNLAPFAPNDVSLMIEPHEVLVYVFCEEMTFLGYHRAKVGEVIELPYKQYKQIYTATVGTGKDVPIESLFTQFEVGKKYDKSDLLFELTPMAGYPDLAQSPTDFMYASDNFKLNPYNDKNVIYYLYLEPRIGAIKIVSHNLKEWANKTFGESGLPEDQFTYIVGTTDDKYNLDGNLYGNQKSYRPSTLYDDSKSEVSTPMFNMMPTNIDKSMMITIYRNGTQVFQNQLYPKSGRQIVMPRAPYIIHLYFDENTSFSVIPAEFEDIYIHVDF